MKTKRDNRIILDLNKCQWARFYYRNQHGDTRNYKPDPNTTIRNIPFAKDEKALFHPMFPNETACERAARLGLLDVWIPEIYFKVTANAGVIYTGAKAVSMHKAWNAKIFGAKQN